MKRLVLVILTLLTISANSEAMLPANAKILVCPYCHGEKQVLQLMSGNTIGGTQWSDLKSVFPMLPRPSDIQKCPHCGKYYFLSSVETKEGYDISSEKGNLSYEQIKEALKQFTKDSLSVENEIDLRLLFVHIYNDTYQRESVSGHDTPGSADKELFTSQVLRLIEIWDIEPLIKAELYREIGEFDKCVQILDSQIDDDSFKLKIAKKMKALALQHKTYAFIIEY